MIAATLSLYRERAWSNRPASIAGPQGAGDHAALDWTRLATASAGGARVLVKSCAAAIVLVALVTPTCCLDGAHAHGDGLDGFGAICISRAELR
ncbi:MAG: hypothetical protein ABSG83_04610 [Roseiarcus sp.]|jgi:hypothetical protein